MHWTKYSYETNGAFTEVACTVKPGYANPPHHHTRFAETFTAKKGTLSVTLEDKQMKLNPGDAATVEIGRVHSLLNDSDEDVEFVCRLEPGNEGFEKGMYIVHGFANDGYSNGEGVPNNSAHAAVLLYLMDTWLAGWGWWLATPAVAIIKRTAQGLGIEARLLSKYWDE
jgi:quercetin dioxygenase-like cupin family protein